MTQFFKEYQKNSILNLENKTIHLLKLLDNFMEFEPEFILITGSFLNKDNFRDIDFVIVSNYFSKYNLIERLKILSVKGRIYDPIPRTLTELFISIKNKDRIYYELKKGFYELDKACYI